MLSSSATMLAPLLLLRALLFWVDFAHPEEWAPAAVVVAGVAIGAFVLLRVTFAGTRRRITTTLPPKGYSRLIVPVDGREVSEEAFLLEAVPLACALAAEGDGTTPGVLELAYVIEVPRALAVTAEMPEEEQEAQRILDSASEIVRKKGLQATTRIQKGRTFVDGTLRAAQEAQADLMVLSIQLPRDMESGGLATASQDSVITPLSSFDDEGDAAAPAEPTRLEIGATDTCQTSLGQILRRATCEVMLARTAPRV